VEAKKQSPWTEVKMTALEPKKSMSQVKENRKQIAIGSGAPSSIASYQD